MKSLEQSINTQIVDDFNYFLRTVLNWSLHQHSFSDTYEAPDGEPALASDVAYFSPQITLEDGMRHIAQSIATAPIDPHDRVCNTIVKHFYGAIGIHNVFTRDPNRETALVDFRRLHEDHEYEMFIRKNIEDAETLGFPIYGNTEIRTSLWGQANPYAAKKTGLPRNTDKINTLLWIASFIESGFTTELLEAKSLEELYKAFTSRRGIGPYYGYHGATTQSVNPLIAAHHDEDFCVPGPGAKSTLDLMFGKDCKVPYGERVVWFRHNYEKFIGKIDIPVEAQNLWVNGEPIYAEPQDGLKVFGTEVAMCQYGIFRRFREKPELAKRRKMPRFEDFPTESFFNVPVEVVA